MVMKRLGAMVVGMAVAVAIPSVSLAQYSLGRYKAIKNGSASALTRTTFRNYITGVGYGLNWANAKLEATGKDPLFCMPSRLSVDTGLILSLLDQEIANPTVVRAGANGRYPDNVPVEGLLVNSFMDRFPCHKKQ